jgi:hypothetical protein
MKKLSLGCLLAVSALSFTAAAEQMTGYVSEAMCGAKHSAPSTAATKCVEKCLQGGSDPVLVSEGKVMKFDADSKDKAKAFAGKNVTVDGTMDGDMVKINSISEASK